MVWNFQDGFIKEVFTRYRKFCFAFFPQDKVLKCSQKLFKARRSIRVLFQYNVWILINPLWAIGSIWIQRFYNQII